MFVGTGGAHLLTPVVLNTTSAATVVVGLMYLTGASGRSRW